jgi:hypothetical protein
MSYFNSRGVFLQLMLPSISGPNTVVSMQLARKEEQWDAQNSTVLECLVDSIMVTATSADRGKTFTLEGLSHDVDRDGVVGEGDKAKLVALAQAYVKIINP